MKNYELTNIAQEPEDYRGTLIYTQEDGYKLVTMTISIAANEQSHITSIAEDIPVQEEAEHLTGVDLYHFAVTDGTCIQLLIDTPVGTQEAHYSVHHTTITLTSSHFWTDIFPSDDVEIDPLTSQEILDDALSYYADLIRDSLQVSEQTRVHPITP